MRLWRLLVLLSAPFLIWVVCEVLLRYRMQAAGLQHVFRFISFQSDRQNTFVRCRKNVACVNGDIDLLSLARRQEHHTVCISPQSHISLSEFWNPDFRTETLSYGPLLVCMHLSLRHDVVCFPQREIACLTYGVLWRTWQVVYERSLSPSSTTWYTTQ